MNSSHAECAKGHPCKTWGGRIHDQDPAVTTPVHQRPTSCHVCGTAADQSTGRPSCAHDWTNAEAFAEADEHDRQVRLARTPDAAYVATHRPY